MNNCIICGKGRDLEGLCPKCKSCLLKREHFPIISEWKFDSIAREWKSVKRELGDEIVTEYECSNSNCEWHAEVRADNDDNDDKE